MRKTTIITLFLIALGMASSVAAAQEAKPVPAPAQTPKAPRPARPGRTPATTPAPPQPSEAPAQAEPITVKLARGGKVAISSRSGQITLSGWDRDVVQASAAGENGPEPIETQTTGDSAHPRLLLIAPSSARRLGSLVKLDVKVPHYAEVETPENYRGDIEISDVHGATLINAGNGDVKVTRAGPLKISRRSGDVTVKEVKGDFTARSYHGPITVDNVSGVVDVAATNGDLVISNAGGDVRANSASGDIDVHCAKGRADVSSASGSIKLIGIRGEVEASTASGQVIFTGTIRADGTYRLKSLSGAVTMTIQPDAPGFTATLSTYSGGLETEFPLKVESPVERGPLNRRLTGTFGDGKVKISLDSFGGAVKLAKGNAAALKECK